MRTRRRKPAAWRRGCLSKKGTPTMGGIMIVAVLFFSTVLWTQLDSKLVLLTLLSVLVLSGLGFYDDYAKIIQQAGGGTPPRVKLVTQFALATFIGVYLWMTPSTGKLVSEIMVPFCKHPVAVNAGVDRPVDRGAGDCRQLECGESHRRSRRAGDRLHADCRVCVSGVHLCGGQYPGGGLSADSLCARGGRIDGVLRGDDRRRAGIFMVQLPSGAGVHGRHRVARAGRRLWHHCGADSSAVCADDCRRRVRAWRPAR